MKPTQQLMAHREPDADDYAAQDDAHKHLKRQHEATRRAIGNPFAKVLK